MRTLRSEITISGQPEDVWRVLVDFARYPEWNPFVVEIAGVALAGERLRVRLRPPGGRGITLKPAVTEASPPRSLQWLGHLGVPGIFDGRHTFELETVPGGTRLVQREEFTGVLVPLLARSLDRSTIAGFRAMNAALKERVEHVVEGSSV